jgi:UDP-N-acetylglucosamine 2-epimerase (non-hydrolysing)
VTGINQLKILTVIGTRPEAIKLAPVVLEFRRSPEIESTVCVTAQHRQMLDQVNRWFGIDPDVDLDLMAHNQKLSDFAAKALTGINGVLEDRKPDVVVVQGDTTTAMMATLAAVYQKIQVAHVEAGLRTRDLFNPFPEEINRRVISAATRYHFAPTERAAGELRREGIEPSHIHVTGNTVIDALRVTAERDVPLDYPFLNNGTRIILVTAHRRESFGAPFESLCRALRQIADTYIDVELVYPVHLNPNVREPVNRILAGHPRIHLIEPLGYQQFVHMMMRSYFILTDSGGVQEEAPFLGKPALVMRDNTERPEAVEAGTALLVGTDTERIVEGARNLLNNEAVYQAMAKAGSPFGDGSSAQRIASILLGFK